MKSCMLSVFTYKINIIRQKFSLSNTDKITKEQEVILLLRFACLNLKINVGTNTTPFS